MSLSPRSLASEEQHQLSLENPKCSFVSEQGCPPNKYYTEFFRITTKEELMWESPCGASRVQETANLIARHDLHRCRWRFPRTARRGVLATGVKTTAHGLVMPHSPASLQEISLPPQSLS